MTSSRFTKDDLSRPWILPRSTYLDLKGVHEPWIAEISPAQYAGMSDRQKKAYDKKRSAEWKASGDCEIEFARAVIEAYDQDKFSKEDAKLSDDAHHIIIMELIERDKQKAKDLLNRIILNNRIKTKNDVKVGSKVFSVVFGYGIVKTINKKTIKIHVKRDYMEFDQNIDPKFLQWLSHDDLMEKARKNKKCKDYQNCLRNEEVLGLLKECERCLEVEDVKL